MCSLGNIFLTYANTPELLNKSIKKKEHAAPGCSVLMKRVLRFNLKGGLPFLISSRGPRAVAFGHSYVFLTETMNQVVLSYMYREYCTASQMLFYENNI